MKPMSGAMLKRVLDYCYDRAVGAPDAPGGAAELAAEFTHVSRSRDENLDELVRWQVAKCAAAGFVTGLGGLVTIPVSLPADLFANYYVQVRMIAAIALICGHDVRSDKVRSLVYVCLAGNAATDLLKDAGTQLGTRVVEALLNRLAGRSLANAGKAIPLLGGFVSCAIDATACKVVGETARRVFTQQAV